MHYIQHPPKPLRPTVSPLLATLFAKRVLIIVLPVRSMRPLSSGLFIPPPIFDWLDILWFSADALEQLCDALRHSCIIYTDTTMALSGINKRLLATFGGECRCYISDPRVVRAAKTQGITRSMAAVDIAIAEEEKKQNLCFR
ncbi:cobalt-precorrin-8X methylmutase [Salmonella enterica subsp. arizonae]|uniref:Cobalt-precorrin-8X methylmutase n=1 Tax=Salmonella enterica subsp. arizonae TaxID=59203 RepID=A0A379SKM6_SALER|nr:cobalt-precorrin-8X methylmutase [Salmonella enterica subsp. arizonae]